MQNKPVISIVDDDQSVREGTRDLLDAVGFATQSFSSADAFLNSDRRHCTSCLITDVRMPGMTGLELYRHLAATGANIPTILITAFPNATDRADALASGVHCYLPKPFGENTLLECIRSALEAGKTGGRT